MFKIERSSLTSSKNALTKQYRRLFEIDGVQLKFTDSSLLAIARKSLERKSGARGLRAILETALMDVMYDVPSEHNIKEVVIDEDVIAGLREPMVVYQNQDSRVAPARRSAVESA